MIWQLWIIGSCIGLLLISIRQFFFARRLQFLSNVALPERSSWPKISLIVPACNEESTIGPALRSLLALEYPHLEIIVVNDRSTDRTGEIIAQVCGDSPRARIVTVDSLPKGWLGKVHAQHQALKEATGEWILFTDADVHFAKDALKKTVVYCEQEQLEFLTLVPHIIAHGFWIKACITQFLSSGALAIDIRSVQNTKKREAIGCGAFNFVKREAYLRSPGLEWLSMEVIDDGGFAFMMKSVGAKSDLLSGLHEVSLEWYPNVKSYVFGLEKNSFSIFQYQLSYLLVFTILVVHWMSGLYVIPFIDPNETSFTVLVLSFVVYHVSNVLMMKKVSDFPLYMVFVLPLAKLFSLVTVWRGAVLCTLRGGVYWRKTFYSKQELIANQRVKVMNFILRKKFD